MRSAMKPVHAAVLGAVLIGAAVIPPGTMADVAIERLIEIARTKANHEAIAAHYEQEAALLRQKAEEHVRLAFLYRRGLEGTHGNGERLAEHCEGLVEKYKAAAEENVELAILHRELAAQAAE